MVADSKVELIDGHVSAKQCKKAVEALLKHEVKRQAEQQESQLLPGKEQSVWLAVTLKQMHPEKKLKPHRIPVVHPIVDPRTSSVCLITKDPQREYKDLLEEKQIRFVTRVVGVEKLKGKFKGYEERRMLLKENDLFLADERVIPLLPGLLGSKWFKAKKQPIPVCLTRKDLKGELERAISSTYYHQNQGTATSIKIATLSQPASHVLDNLKTALPAVVKAVKGGWDNIQSLGIKTSTSVNLPIWTCDLGTAEGGRWNGLVDVEMESAEQASGDEDTEAEEVKEQATTSVKGKGKKRSAEDDEEKPKKKAKPSLSEDSTANGIDNGTSTSKVEVPAASTTPAATTKAKKRKEKTGTVDPTSKAPVSAPVAVSAASSSSVAEAATPSDTTGKRKERHRKRKNAGADGENPKSVHSLSEIPSGAAPPVASSHTEPTPSEPQTSSSQAEQPPKKQKRKSRAAAAVPSEAVSTPDTPEESVPASAAAPATPSVPKTKKSRASAADFFDDANSLAAAAQATPASIAPPPNTPAAGIAAHKRKTKRVDGTPVSKAIGKLTEAAKGEDGAPEAQEQAQPEAEAESAKPRKERKKRKAAAAAIADEASAAPTESAPSVTVQDIKAKRSASGAEKKKDKALKAKKSAKDALIGKKGL